MAREQPTNSLERFRKRSPRLVLEEHDHCEVPAGCGGVVLRWRNPHAAQPYFLHAWVAAGEWTVLLDGAAPPSTRIDLAPGPHVLAFSLADADRAGALLTCALLYDPADGTRSTISQTRHLSDVWSAGDDTWLAAITPPPDGWATVEAPLTGWIPLIEVAAPRLRGSEEGQYRLEHCQWIGARCLGLRGGRGRGPVWVRRPFTVAAPE